MNVKQLEDKSKNIRLKIFETIIEAGKGHLGGALSCVDLIVTLYYGKILRFKNLLWYISLNTLYISHHSRKHSIICCFTFVFINTTV